MERRREKFHAASPQTAAKVFHPPGSSTIVSRSVEAGREVVVAAAQGPSNARKSPTKLTDRIRREIVSRYQAGQAGRDIAAVMALGQTMFIRVVRAEGLEPRYARRSPQVRAEIAELYRGGMAQIEIARKVALHKGHVWHVLERAGLVGTTPREDRPRP